MNFLFDLDGTLTDPKEGITKCVHYALAHFGIDEPDLNKLTKFIGPPLPAAFMEFYGLNKAQAEVALQAYRERFAPIGIFENRLYDGIFEMLSACKESGHKVALATSKPEIYAQRILEKYGIMHYFDVIVGSELDGRRGDKAEVIAEALLQLQYGESIMIGDRSHDIIGAKKCGVKSIGVQYGYAESGELETAGADYIVHDVLELKSLLNRF